MKLSLYSRDGQTALAGGEDLACCGGNYQEMVKISKGLLTQEGQKDKKRQNTLLGRRD